jgi:hypothetical protein
MIERPNYYAILSAEVRYDNRLKPNVKLLYAEITALCNMNKECYASNKYFSELYNKSKGTISGWISDLVNYGYIKVRYTYKQGTKEIEYRYIRILKGGVSEKSNTLLSKNLQSNNTINNNTSINNKGRFIVPVLSDINNYCKQRKNNIDPLAFYDFYESKNWYIGKNKMKDWKAAIRTWERRDKKNPTSKIDSQLSEYLKGKNLL